MKRAAASPVFVTERPWSKAPDGYKSTMMLHRTVSAAGYSGAKRMLPPSGGRACHR